MVEKMIGEQPFVCIVINVFLVLYAVLRLFGSTLINQVNTELSGRNVDLVNIGRNIMLLCILST